MTRKRNQLDGVEGGVGDYDPETLPIDVQRKIKQKEKAIRDLNLRTGSEASAVSLQRGGE